MSTHIPGRKAKLDPSFSRSLPALPQEMRTSSEEQNMHEPFDMPKSTNVVSPSRAPVISNNEVRRNHKRRISSEAGHALELLGHAIEYLTDELVYEGGRLSAHNGQLEAIGLLMARNRAIYFSCPETPGLGEQWRTFFRAHFRRLMFADSVPPKR
jgi:hypothetical protein